MQTKTVKVHRPYVELKNKTRLNVKISFTETYAIEEINLFFLIKKVCGCLG